MTKTIELIVGAVAIEAAIKANAKAHSKVDNVWHVIATSSIAHFAEHGDTGFINRTFLAMGKGARHVAMEAFFLAFGGVVVNTDPEGKKTNPFAKDRTETPKLPDVEAATQSPWYTMKPSPDVGTAIDYLSLALKAIKRSPKEGQTIEHGALRQMLAETIGKYADENGIEGIALPTFLDEKVEETEEK